MTTARTPPGIWTGQWLHVAGALVLLTAVWVAWSFLARPYPLAFWTGIAFPVVHQIFVWLAWRLELRSSATSRAIGFRGYLAVFFLLFGGRFVALAALAWLDRGSLQFPILPHAVATTLCGLPGLYAAYSVAWFFGFVRAAGADHFDPQYRSMPLVTQGIFRFTSNGMYSYVFLSFWALAFAFNSTAAITVAAFSHIHIWIHFYTTEKLDMEYLYGSG